MVSASQDTQNAHTDQKAQLKALVAQREHLEQQLSVATARLEASGVGLHGSLVDKEVRGEKPVVLEG